MRTTNIKQYVDMKTKALEELQAIYVSLKDSQKTSIVYQNTYYDARVLVGQMQRIENQIQGAFNIVESVSNEGWGTSHLAYIENIAKEEFGYHMSVDSQYYLTVADSLLAKILGDINSEDGVDVKLLVKRLAGVKEKLLRNTKANLKLSHKTEWVRDRYFEIASFIKFDKDKEGRIIPIIPDATDSNSFYDVVINGDKTLDELKASNLFFDVAMANSGKIKDATAKDLLFEINMSNAK